MESAVYKGSYGALDGKDGPIAITDGHNRKVSKNLEVKPQNSLGLTPSQNDLIVKHFKSNLQKPVSSRFIDPINQRKSEKFQGQLVK